MSSSGKAEITTTNTKLAGATQRPSSLFSPPTRRPRGAAVPEWKLSCLSTEYGLPPTMRGALQTGGHF